MPRLFIVPAAAASTKQRGRRTLAFEQYGSHCFSIIINLFIITKSVLFGFGRAFGFISRLPITLFTFYQSYGVTTLLPSPLYLSKLFSLSISLFLYIYPLPLSTLLYCTPLYNLSLKLWQLLGFCLLAVLPYCRSSPSCIALLFTIVAINSIHCFSILFNSY